LRLLCKRQFGDSFDHLEVGLFLKAAEGGRSLYFYPYDDEGDWVCIEGVLLRWLSVPPNSEISLFFNLFRKLDLLLERIHEYRQLPLDAELGGLAASLPAARAIAGECL